MRPRGGDEHVREAIDELRWSGEVHPAVVFGPTGELARILAGRAFDEHSLHRTYHGFTDGERLRIELRLQSREPLLLHFLRHLIGQRCGRRTRPAAVDEAEGLIETHVPY